MLSVPLIVNRDAAARMKLTKIQVAELNLQAAIRLFFECENAVPIETLNAAASGVLRAIAKARGLRSMLHDHDMIRDEYRKDWIGVLHSAQNFFKHADRDTAAELDYDPQMLHFLMLETCHLYRHLASDQHLGYHQLKEALAFEIWFTLKYPRLLIDPDAFRKFPGGEVIENISPDDFEFWRDAIRRPIQARVSEKSE